MSREEGRRQQAKDLLRAMTDIDDRFLEEAMKDTQQLDSSFEYDPERVEGKLPGETTFATPETELSGRKASAVPEKERPEEKVTVSSRQDEEDTSVIKMQKRPGMLRRYSSWALTAAACLTVIVVGRYVSINSVRTDLNTTAIESEWKHEDNKNEAGEAVQESAAPKADGADLAQEKKTDDVISADSAQEAGVSDNSVSESFAVQSSGEQAENLNQEMNAAGEEASQEMDAAGEEASQEMDAAGEEASQEMDAAGEEAEDVSGAAVPAGNQAALGLANPFVDLKNIEEAQKEAGFEIRLPGEAAPYDTVVYRAIPKEMIEVIYYDRDENEGYRIRKAVNTTEDISGDSTEYAAGDTLKTEDGTEILVRGDKEGAWSVACWGKSGKGTDSYSCAVIAGAKTFTSKEILEIVSVMEGNS